MKILAVAGASGGHIYPALAFLEKIKIKNEAAVLLLALPLRSIRLNPGSLKVEYFSSTLLSLTLSLKSFKGFFTFLKGSWECLIIFLRFRPDLVIGFGSLDSIPLIIAAWFFRVKTIIHEQNLLPGKANRFLARFVDKVAVSFPESSRYLSIAKEKIVLTGNPIRPALKLIDKKEARVILGLDLDKFTLLVMGGSQGSRSINSVFIEALSRLRDREILQVVHLSGRGDCSMVKDGYAGIAFKAVKVLSFSEEMGIIYSASDLAITRAGATTVAELVYFRLPAAVIPYPFAYSHQSLNADILQRSGSGLVIQENAFNQESLAKALDDLVYNSEKIALMRKGFEKIPFYDSASLLSDLALNLK
ncbi:MAG: UDP-N-acetylglucosamine--N-acetylmuramyl-(pentapeptide) pyrophosphoryl-undecaprenol N-acetylglucosamine transferase [Candidatus Omnitrophica bacterium]|nr:UDP-N-acetylglucosamine--N-acetylmuramyl-(pentapeptide) pyrophosphoryl-undecaprenol N-acetylglucosamine transferase [Candidatus Omnitrophota bacterium]